MCLRPKFPLHHSCDLSSHMDWRGRRGLNWAWESPLGPDSFWKSMLTKIALTQMPVQKSVQLSSFKARTVNGRLLIVFALHSKSKKLMHLGWLGGKSRRFDPTRTPPKIGASVFISILFGLGFGGHSLPSSFVASWPTPPSTPTPSFLIVLPNKLWSWRLHFRLRSVVEKKSRISAENRRIPKQWMEKCWACFESWQKKKQSPAI